MKKLKLVDKTEENWLTYLQKVKILFEWSDDLYNVTFYRFTEKMP